MLRANVGTHVTYHLRESIVLSGELGIALHGADVGASFRDFGLD
jgi:hypothetical protein